MRRLAPLFLLFLASCWVTPDEVQNKINEFEPTETADTGPADTGLE